MTQVNQQPPIFSSGLLVPTLTFATPGDLTVAYATQTGYWVKLSNSLCFVSFTLVCTPTYTTAASTLLIVLSSGSTPPPVCNAVYGSVLNVGGLASTVIWPASRTNITARIGAGGSNITLYGMGSAISTTSLTTTALLSGTAGTFVLSGIYPI